MQYLLLMEQIKFEEKVCQEMQHELKEAEYQGKKVTLNKPFRNTNDTQEQTKIDKPI
jgi:hypothetical protein